MLIEVRKKVVKTAVLRAGLLFAFMMAGFVGAQDLGLVARKDFSANQEWQPPQVMGRSFWNILPVTGSDFWGNILGKNRIHADEFCFNKHKDKALYKESGRMYASCILNKENNTVTASEIFQSSWPLYKKNHGFLFKDAFEITLNPETPFFFMSDGDVRPTWGYMVGEHNYDFAGYEQWKKDYPNFMGFSVSEWCNECINVGPWRENGPSENFKKRLDDKQLEKSLREFPTPSTREESLALVKKICGIAKKFYFNDPEKLGFLRSIMNVEHYTYEWGGDMNWLETTSTGSYRWQPAFFFARGASHQYNKKWGWYLASYYNGYPAEGGDRVGDSTPSFRVLKKQSNTYAWMGPDFGMSLSLYTRGMYLAYLAGPNFVAHEEIQKFIDKDGDFSSWGKALEEWFDFTQKNKRGISYAPVALLIPFEQCYPVPGGKAWDRYKYERPDWMLDSFMFTIAPHNPNGTREGNEGCLSNSPYGDIYDAILPNTPEKPVSLNVLNKYKVAVMLGSYAKDKALAERLMEYVKDGGTLFINVKQLNEFFPESFTGIERTGAIQPVKGDALSLSDNAKIALPGEYECEKINLKGAKAVLADSGNNTLASVNNYGKGRVIVATVDYLVPKNDLSKQGDVLGSFVFGKEFPLPVYFMKQIVKEVLPLEVKGDIQYGLNKLDDSWLLYLINNKGVTKFVDKIQSVAPSKTAKVEVFLKDLQSSGITELREQKVITLDEKRNSFTIEVPPGEVKVIKIKD